MEGCFTFLFTVLGLILWGMFALLMISLYVAFSAVSVFTGFVGGVFVGIIKGVKSYFSALKECLLFDTDY